MPAWAGERGLCGLGQVNSPLWAFGPHGQGRMTASGLQGEVREPGSRLGCGGRRPRPARPGPPCCSQDAVSLGVTLTLPTLASACGQGRGGPSQETKASPSHRSVGERARPSTGHGDACCCSRGWAARESRLLCSWHRAAVYLCHRLPLSSFDCPLPLPVLQLSPRWPRASPHLPWRLPALGGGFVLASVGPGRWFRVHASGEHCRFWRGPSVAAAVPRARPWEHPGHSGGAGVHPIPTQGHWGLASGSPLSEAGPLALCARGSLGPMEGTGLGSQHTGVAGSLFEPHGCSRRAWPLGLPLDGVNFLQGWGQW